MNNREKFTTQTSPESQEINAVQILRDAERELTGHSLASREGIDGLETWRNLDEKGKSARDMRRFLDTLSAYDMAARKDPQSKDALAREIKKSVGGEALAPGEVEEFTRQEELARLFLAKKNRRRAAPGARRGKKDF